jgi:hypothetical protein
MPLLCAVAPGRFCCLKARPAGEESRDECGEAAEDGEREVDRDWMPLLKVPVPVPEALGTCCTTRDCVCGVCAGRRSLGHRVTLFVFGSVLFASAAIRAELVVVVAAVVVGEVPSNGLSGP